MVPHSQRLVRALALKYEGRGSETEDLFHHGMRRLMHEVVDFDGGRGLKSSTYVSW
ncbi:sigma factor [Nocardiopsis alba]|uniref:sigma factor n=1 Tax=Nocardiopsis alba TaxID=53437 RepID=UPI0033EC0B17